MPPAEALTMSSTSSDLLTLVRHRNHEAWGRFVALYAPLVYGWCRKGGISAADAADVTQDVFAKVFTAIAEFRHDRPGDTLRGWLRVICRNKLNDHFRARAGGPAAAGGTDAKAMLAEIAADEFDETTIATERQSLARRAAELVKQEFEPRTWQAFWLTAVEHRTAPEAAEQLEMTPGAVRQAKYMVLRRLREELAGEFD
jgi:RNA polymerase sigma-70 factor (ECF subfamily)